jgi:hypothetical protein
MYYYSFLIYGIQYSFFLFPRTINVKKECSDCPWETSQRTVRLSFPVIKKLIKNPHLTAKFKGTAMQH